MAQCDCHGSNSPLHGPRSGREQGNTRSLGIRPIRHNPTHRRDRKPWLFQAFRECLPLLSTRRIAKYQPRIHRAEHFDYLLLVDRVDDYRREFLPPTSARTPGLVAGTNWDSDEVPLRRSTRSGLRHGRVVGVVTLGGDGHAFDVVHVGSDAAAGRSVPPRAGSAWRRWISAGRNHDGLSWRT